MWGDVVAGGNNVLSLVTRVLTVRAGISLVGAGALGYTWWTHRPAAIANNVLQTFESGGQPGWDTEFGKDAAASIKRPDVEKQLEEYFYPSSSSSPPTGDLSASYVLVMDAHGTGKSTAVRRVIRNRQGVNGAVYVNVPDDVSEFGDAVSEAVGYTGDVVDLIAGLRRRVNATTKEERAPLPSNEPMVTWNRVSRSIKAAAITFCEKHGRPAALIIDSAELIAKENPKFLSLLQTFAKKMTDDGILRVVFVSSDGSVFKQLDSENASSRSLDPYEVGDICDEDAVVFLTGKGVEKNQAVEAVRDITGGRFALLQRYVGSWAAKGNKATSEKLFEKTSMVLDASHIDERHEFFRALVDKTTIKDRPARQLWGGTDKFDSAMRVLVGNNIVSAHPNSTYTFHSRHVETFFKEVFRPGGGGGGGTSGGAGGPPGTWGGGGGGGPPEKSGGEDGKKGT
jgi:hypothetical protein